MESMVFVQAEAREVSAVERRFTLGHAQVSPDVELLSGELIIRSDGTANWIARAQSKDTNDTVVASFAFLRADGSPVYPDIKIGPFRIPVLFHVQSLKMPAANRPYDWGSGFIFPREGWAAIAAVALTLTG